MISEKIWLLLLEASLESFYKKSIYSLYQKFMLGFGDLAIWNEMEDLKFSETCMEENEKET